MPKIVISPVDPWWKINTDEILESRDLIWFLLKRDFVSEYKQTFLGNIWFILQPLGGTIIFTIIFGNFAKLGTDGMPPLIFYHSGVIIWTFFQGCLNGSASALSKNAGLYQKVYFPRLISPIVEILNSLWKFLLNFFIFLGFFIYFLLFSDAHLEPNKMLLLFPLILLTTMMLGTGIGLILSSFTVKYRDLRFLTPILLQLWMYFSPIIYSSSLITGKLAMLFWLNPMVSLLEINRYAFTGIGLANVHFLLYSFSVAAIIFLCGLFFFNRVQQTFVDRI